MASAAPPACGRRRWRASRRPASRRWRWICRATVAALLLRRWISMGSRPTSSRRSNGEACTRPILVGHSMGGMIAQTALRRRPDGYAAAVLACTSPAFGSADGAFQTKFVADRLGPLDAGRTMADLAPKMVDRMIGPAADPAGCAHAVEVMSAVPAETYRAAVRCLVGFDERANLAKIWCSRAVSRRREGPERSGRGAWSAWQARFPAPAMCASPASDTCRTWRLRPPSMLLSSTSCATRSHPPRSELTGP